jgi:hypothetical protein
MIHVKRVAISAAIIRWQPTLVSSAAVVGCQLPQIVPEIAVAVQHRQRSAESLSPVKRGPAMQ